MEVAAPIATITGWNLRATGTQAGRSLRAERLVHPVREDQGGAARQRGDPRPSLEERYGDARPAS